MSLAASDTWHGDLSNVAGMDPLIWKFQTLRRRITATVLICEQWRREPVLCASDTPERINTSSYGDCENDTSTKVFKLLTVLVKKSQHALRP